MVASPALPAVRWLSLVAALYLAFAPLNGFVVCHEPDGAVHVELATSEQRCAGCDDREQERREPCRTPSCSRDHRDCPCVDVPLTLDGVVARTDSSRHEESAPLVALAPASSLPLPFAVESAPRAIEVVPPAPPPGLRHLRSVVLVV